MSVHTCLRPSLQRDQRALLYNALLTAYTKIKLTLATKPLTLCVVFHTLLEAE
jgi:hypothetical protein